jgi:outer membrane protein assembly factor BamA
MQKHTLTTLILVFLFVYTNVAQTDSNTIVIERIDVTGHYITRKAFIMREIDIRVGDRIARTDLAQIMENNELRLLNAKVFNEVEIKIDQTHPRGGVTLCIDGREPRYTDFVPLLELADRNFNVWARDYQFSYRRINIGGYLKHNNITGQGDPVRLLLQFGYTNKYELIYRLPFANRTKTIGLEVQALFLRSREVNFVTKDNRQLFYFNPDQFQYFRRRVILQGGYKRGNFHAFILRSEYHFNTISDTIARELNPEFFGKSRQQQIYGAVAVLYEYDRRDRKPYPLRGSLLRLEIKQNGFGKKDDVHLTSISGTVRRYKSYTPSLSYELDMAGRLTLFRKRPPFVNNRALGYFDHYVRGYEFYVIDGLDFALAKSSFRYRILKKPLTKVFKRASAQNFRQPPVRLYFALNTDLGFVNEPYLRKENPLSNRPILGYGVGLDLVYRYNTVWRLELSRNDRGEFGYYLNIGSKR